MSSPKILRKLLILVVFGLAAVPASGQEAAGPDPAVLADKFAKPKAILEITRDEGVCFWTLTGDDQLVRLPVENEPFKAVLLSANFEGDSLQVSLAGEDRPLETALLGRYLFSPLDTDSAATPDALAKGARSKPWQIRVVSAFTKALSGCCGCSLEKITCCPATGKCLTCGGCGTCCN
jgi:hypothetical protein